MEKNDKVNVALVTVQAGNIRSGPLSFLFFFFFISSFLFKPDKRVGRQADRRIDGRTHGRQAGKQADT